MICSAVGSALWTKESKKVEIERAKAVIFFMLVF